MLIVQCLSMLVSTTDMNLLVIATNSSMPWLDCSPDSGESRPPATVSSIRTSAPPFSASDVTSRVCDLRYNRATTRNWSSSVPRLNVPLWNATVCAVNERASSYSRISTHFESGHDSLPQSVTMSLDAMQVLLSQVT